jgi:pimeloyl-ACP methyl ester carboxylesterase
MGPISERFVTVAGGPCRLLEAGDGPPLGVMPGHGGMPRWTPFLSALASTHRVILISPPGFPGSGRQYEQLDSHLDWLTATLDLLEAAGLEGGDLLASSVAGILAADVAALAPGFLRGLGLAGPYGLFDVVEPVRDIFAVTADEIPGLLCRDPRRYAEAFGEPDDLGAVVDWRMMSYRAASAAARLAWPFGDRGLAKRLHRLRLPVQLIWGADDGVVPPSYARRFAAALPAGAETVIIKDAGHLVWIDQPAASAAAVSRFFAPASTGLNGGLREAS